MGRKALHCRRRCTESGAQPVTANAVGIPVITGASEATAVGNIMEQLYALGAYRTREEKCNILAASFDTAEYLPQDTDVWDEAYQRFEQLYQ